MVSIEKYKFKKGVEKELRETKFGNRWPVVYIINNNKEAYIGESTNAYDRARQHLDNPTRQILNEISIIGDEKFNKSITLHLESFLIKYMAADNKFKLQNGNSGMHAHNYYGKDEYEAEFKNIWEQLRNKGIVRNSLDVIENLNLYKYSPYKTLNNDQFDILSDILKILSDDVKKKQESTFIIHGGAGTGKTVLAVYMMEFIEEFRNKKNIKDDEITELNIINILKIFKLKSDFKVGLVIPMDNLRSTLKKVFNKVNGLNPKMVISPNDVAKSDEKYDLLIVDESHRLRKRKNIAQYGTFDKNNTKFNLGHAGTELDWIKLKSKHQILFYDEEQSIKPTDIDKEVFKNLENKKNTHSYSLKIQERCIHGGETYVKYVKQLFSQNPPKNKLYFKQYDFKIFDDVDEMINNIKSKDDMYGLCRNVAGYDWKWNSKKRNSKDKNEVTNNEIQDIDIERYKYKWNSNTNDWINSENAIDEIGCIHTVQGFDLNYTGLIIGKSLKYDDINHRIYADKNNYFDRNGKAGTTDEKLLEYLLHIYSTMCTRGVRGTYLYVCDPKLKQYLSKYVSNIKDLDEGIIYDIDENKVGQEYKIAQEIDEEYKY